MPFDEQGSFVVNQEKPCDRDDPDDDLGGDCWDHVALDAESRLVVRVVPGRQSAEPTVLWVEDVAARTGGEPRELFTSDANPADAAALLEVDGEWVPPQRQGTRGRQPQPVQVPPAGLTDATMPKWSIRQLTVGLPLYGEAIG